MVPLGAAAGAAKRLTFQKWEIDLRFLLAGVVAQLVEHHNGIVGVRGSNPLGSTILSIMDWRGERMVFHPLALCSTPLRTVSNP